MGTTFKRTLIGLLLAGCLGLGCNLLSSSALPPGDGAPASPTPGRQEPNATAAPRNGAQQSATNTAPGLLDLATLEDIQYPTNVGSYRVTFDHTLESASTNGGTHAEGGVSANPPGATLTETRQGGAIQGGGSAVDKRVIDGLITLLDGTTCNMINPAALAGPAPPTQILPRPSSFLVGDAAWAEGGVAVNGRLTDHYVLDVGNFDPTLIKLDSLDSGDVYIDPQDGFLVRLAFRGVGIDQTLAWAGPGSPGTSSYELNYLDFGTSVEVQPLEQCGPVPATDWPLVDRDILRYQSDLGSSFFDLTVIGRLDEAIQFYKKELASDGWNLVQEEHGTPRRASLMFERPSGSSLSLDFRNDSPSDKAADELDIITIIFLSFDF